MPGVEISHSSNADHITNKFPPGIKFMSGDTSFTTENPKWLSAIFPRPTESYTADTRGGQALDFYTTTNSPGATNIPIPRMTINNNGNVGIGTTAPGTQLQVEGQITLNSASFPRVIHEISNTAIWTVGPRDTDDYYIYRESGTGDVIINNGNVGIGVIDPDSKLEVNGNVHIDGDLFFETEGSGLPYGSCYGNDIAWTQVAAINVVYNVSDADMVTGQLNLATHDGSGKLTVTKAGRYKCDYTATIKSSIAGKHIISGFEVSGSGNMEPAGRNHIDLVGANNQLECSGNAILDLAANATIEMAISSSDAGNPTVTVEHLNITLFQIGGT